MRWLLPAVVLVLGAAPEAPDPFAEMERGFEAAADAVGPFAKAFEICSYRADRPIRDERLRAVERGDLTASDVLHGGWKPPPTLTRRFDLIYAGCMAELGWVAN